MGLIGYRNGTTGANTTRNTLLSSYLLPAGNGKPIQWREEPCPLYNDDAIKRLLLASHDNTVVKKKKMKTASNSHHRRDSQFLTDNTAGARARVPTEIREDQEEDESASSSSNASSSITTTTTGSTHGSTTSTTTKSSSGIYYNNCEIFNELHPSQINANILNGVYKVPNLPIGKPLARPPHLGATTPAKPTNRKKRKISNGDTENGNCSAVPVHGIYFNCVPSTSFISTDFSSGANMETTTIVIPPSSSRKEKKMLSNEERLFLEAALALSASLVSPRAAPSRAAEVTDLTATMKGNEH